MPWRMLWLLRKVDLDQKSKWERKSPIFFTPFRYFSTQPFPSARVAIYTRYGLSKFFPPSVRMYYFVEFISLIRRVHTILETDFRMHLRVDLWYWKMNFSAYNSVKWARFLQNISRWRTHLKNCEHWASFSSTRNRLSNARGNPFPGWYALSLSVSIRYILLCRKLWKEQT